MDEKNVLIQEYVDYSVKDRIYKIGKLKLKQYIRLTKLLSETISGNKEKLSELKENTQNTTNQGDILTLLQMLDENDSYKAISILLDEQDKKFIEDNIGLNELSEIIAIVCECNKFDDIKKNIQRIVKSFQGEKTA